MIKDLNVRLKTVKLLEVNIGRKLDDIGFDNYILDMSPKTQAANKENKLDYIKITNFCISKETINKVQKCNTQHGRKYLKIIYLIQG